MTAFPIVTTDADHPQEWVVEERGMMLRDYFAGQAVVGLLSNNTTDAEVVARFAYVVADEMMARRHIFGDRK